MFRRILIAYDGSPEARLALHVAMDMAASLKAELFSITVQEILPLPVAVQTPIDAETEFVYESMRAESELSALLQEAQSIAHDRGVGLRAETVFGDEIRGILDKIDEHDCDLLVIGLRHHASIIDRLISHTAAALTERAPCSVLGVR